MKGLILNCQVMVEERFGNVCAYLYDRSPQGTSISDIAKAIGWDPKVFFDTIKNPKDASPKTKEALGQAIERIAEFLGVHIFTILNYRQEEQPRQKGRKVR